MERQDNIEEIIGDVGNFLNGCELKCTQTINKIVMPLKRNALDDVYTKDKPQRMTSEKNNLFSDIKLLDGKSILKYQLIPKNDKFRTNNITWM